MNEIRYLGWLLYVHAMRPFGAIGRARAKWRRDRETANAARRRLAHERQANPSWPRS